MKGDAQDKLPGNRGDSSSVSAVASGANRPYDLLGKAVARLGANRQGYCTPALARAALLGRMPSVPIEQG